MVSEFTQVQSRQLANLNDEPVARRRRRTNGFFRLRLETQVAGSVDGLAA
jgi:hypothetical protein